MENIDIAVCFPMSGNIRKNPKISLIMFVSTLIIISTAIVNVSLFAYRCDMKNNTQSPSVSENGHQLREASALGSHTAQALIDKPVHLVSDSGPNFDTDKEFFFDSAKGRIIIPNPTSRLVIPKIAESFKLEKGFEVGVRQGVYSRDTLTRWPSAKSYFLVDLWGNPDNILGKRILQSTQEQNMKDAFENVRKWQHKISHCQNFSTVCAERVEPNSFDYGYIDARHDFKSVYEDIEAWYPKIREGGIMSGHDYMADLELTKGSWKFNADGTKDHSRQGVKGAVNLFFASKGLFIEICTPVPSYTSWVVYKGKSEPNDIIHFIDFRCFYDSNCDFISDRYAHTIRAWESLNQRFIAIVWTAEKLSWFFKDEIGKLKTVYKNDPKAFEEMMKLAVIYKYGGTYVDSSMTPLSGLQEYVKTVRESSEGPAGFCVGVAESGTGPYADNCKEMSRLLMSGNKGDRKILQLLDAHERAFPDGIRSEVESLKISNSVFKTEAFNIFKTYAPFPCDSFSLSPKCVAQVHF